MNPPAETPEDWIRKTLEGSSEAYSGLLRAYQGRVRAYVRRFVLDRNTADDLAQETFLAAYRGLGRFRPGVPVDLWLLGIARNLALKHLRGESRRRAREARSLEAAVAAWTADLAEGDDGRPEALGRELSALDRCLGELPRTSAELVDAAYRRRIPSPEIARRLGKSDVAVRVTLLRIRRVLRQCIELRVGTAEGGA